MIIVAKVTKAGNDLVGSKMANRRFYLKHKSYFDHNNKCTITRFWLQYTISC